MVSKKSVSDQLKKVGFNQYGWGQAEVKQLPDILLPDEEIYECVNGIYEGGFALLVATDIRLILIDKKPFNYLTVEDLRFDMINEIDYNHRLFYGAYTDISTGARDLKFRSFNQARLRKLIGHVQRSMADGKKKQANHQQDQNKHLEQINERLQSYLIAQHEHQQELQRQLQKVKEDAQVPAAIPDPPKPSPELSDYLLAQGLLAQHQAEAAHAQPQPPLTTIHADNVVSQDEKAAEVPSDNDSRQALYDEGRREVFSRRTPHFDLNPLKIASSKLPLALRNKRFGRPSFHTHSQADQDGQPQTKPA